MAFEDFTTYTEIDPGSRLSVTHTDVSGQARRDESNYLYKDYGLDFFSSDLIHKATVTTSNAGNDGGFAFWLLSNEINDMWQMIWINASDCIYGAFAYQSGAGNQWLLREVSGGVRYTDIYVDQSGDLTRCFEIERDEGAGTYGFVFMRVYSDPAKTNLLATLSLALHDSKKDFRYHYAFNQINVSQFGLVDMTSADFEMAFIPPAQGITPAFVRELQRGFNAPNTVIELYASGGLKKYGYHTSGFTDVRPIVRSISSIQNKLDMKKGFATRGQLSFTITGRENFRALIRDEYLKNRRVIVKVGFISASFLYSDYYEIYSGLVSDWSRKGDELNITVSDDLGASAIEKIPKEDVSAPLTTVITDFQDKNPIDIAKELILNYSSVLTSMVDITAFDAERDMWVPSWRFERVLTEPRSLNEYLSELQQEVGGFIFHNGTKIDFKMLAPTAPGVVVDTFSDTYHLIKDSLTLKSGYRDNFYNRIVVYYDYDESGGSGVKDFEAAVLTADPSSQAPAQWAEVRTKTIKSKWIRSRTYNQPVNLSAITIYHMSRANSAGVGVLTYTASTAKLKWQAPSGTPGVEVEVTEDGKFQLFDANNRAYIRVVVNFNLLPSSGTTSDTITVRPLSGDDYARALANRLLLSYRDPLTSVSFEVGINEINNASVIRKPSDVVYLNTDEAFEKGVGSWINKPVMLTSVRPDFMKRTIRMEAIETRAGGTGASGSTRIGFIAPSSVSANYDTATDFDKEYAYIATAGTETVGTAGDPPYLIW